MKKDLTLKEVQKLVDSWINKSGGYWSEFKILGRLIEELGELSQAMRKGRKRKIKNELGDVFFTLIALANKLEIDLESSLELAIKKYSRRRK